MQNFASCSYGLIDKITIQYPAISWYMWPILMKVAQLVFLYRTHTDLVFHGFYLDKCIDLIEGFHAIHSFPYVELETRATEADKAPFMTILEGGLLMKIMLFTFSLK